MMRSGFRIARLFGVNIYIDWSWLLIFFLVTWNLGTLFSQVHPGWGVALNWGMAVIASLLFFASVLAHELGHALMAIAQGIPVHSITLFLFGGVASITREPPSPGKEFLIAVVGPLTSFILGALFTWLGLLRAGGIGNGGLDPLDVAAAADPWTTMLLWLGPINIVLALFNLVPAFPLDGGRIFRSILWAVTNSLHRATRWASLLGQGIAWLLILAGVAMVFGAVLPVLGGGFISGLWFIFIGWFLNNAALQSYRQVVVEDMLEGVPVTRLMRANVPTVPPGIPIGALVYHYLMQTDERAFPVLDGDRLAGLVTLEDVRGVGREDWDTTTVGQIMTPIGDLVVVTPHEDASEVLRKLIQRDVRQVPVLERGRLIGMVRRRDIMRWLQLQPDLNAR